MTPKQTSAFLRYPLYQLYYLDDAGSFEGMSDEAIAHFQDEYRPEVRRGIFAALRWVKENPREDLTGILPGLPHSNEAIHVFALKMLNSLQRIDNLE